MDKPQNFENHAKLFPMFHFVVLPILFINFVASIVRLVRYASMGTAIGVLTAIGLILLALASRLMALTVQDRVIRLEMRVRLAALLPADLRSQIPEFSTGQLVALRFAGDGELPQLARKVLEEKIVDRKAIKKMVRDWQPDFLRA